MPELLILSQMVAPAARVNLLDHYGKSKVVLVEPECPDSSVTICGIPSDAIVIKADFFKSPDSVFVGTRGECKRSDYIIIAKTDNDVVIIYIELKRKKAHRNEIIQQLTGAKCFMSYCIEIGKHFWDEQDFLSAAKHRFVSIGHTSMPKRKTRMERGNAVHDQPDRMLKIDWPHNLQFQKLAA